MKDAPRAVVEYDAGVVRLLVSSDLLRPGSIGRIVFGLSVEEFGELKSSVAEVGAAIMRASQEEFDKLRRRHQSQTSKVNGG